MSNQLSPSAAKVQQALERLGVGCQVVEMDTTTRSAQDAAHAVGCEVGQIAKSLVFKGASSNQGVLVIASGANRVNEKWLAREMGEGILKADPDFVRQKTGFAIGGVPPVGHLQPLSVFIDEDLFRYTDIWAAAGTPQAVFQTSAAELQRITAGKVVCVK